MNAATTRLLRVKPFAALALGVGLTVAVGLVAASNARDVLAAAKSLGLEGFVGIALIQVSLSGVLGLAWWTIAPAQPPRRIGAFVWASLMAEAASNVLPFTQVTGAILATRAAVVGGVRSSVALGSNVADVTLETVAQGMFTLLGIGLLLAHLHDGRLIAVVLPLALVGLLLSAGLAAALFGAQEWGPPLLALITRLFRGGVRTDSFERVLDSIYAKPWRLLAGIGLHLAAWLGTAAATWLILTLMGRPLPFLHVVAIESLQFAARNALFFAPLGLGVQEGAYALLGPMFGLPLQAALALSLLKRARDLVIGAPVLLSWQAMEGRRRWRRTHLDQAQYQTIAVGPVSRAKE